VRIRIKINKKINIYFKSGLKKFPPPPELNYPLIKNIIYYFFFKYIFN